MVVVQR